MNALTWCGVHEDEGPNVGGPYGPYIQSQRLPIYREHAERLIEVRRQQQDAATHARPAS